ncbi:MAG: serine/threonine-protein kinase [Acidobacteriota bacterium]
MHDAATRFPPRQKTDLGDYLRRPGRPADAPSRPPASIGPYRLLHEIGRGGMGRVFLAEQTAPVRRRVAVKLLREHLAVGEALARFELERQALAMMSHPNIAQIFEAGTTEAGLPYFVMEYVPGLAITEFAKRHRLSVPARLRLFLRVCGAVQHAHRKGVVHRDLKPSNILVVGGPGDCFPKVIDFGIAKAVTGGLADDAHDTDMGVLLGTPDYMSPEQIAGDGIDPRTDVYGLGAVLYELLTGRPPFHTPDLASGDVIGRLRAVYQGTPTPPSRRPLHRRPSSPERSPKKRTRATGSETPSTEPAEDPRDRLRGLPSDLDGVVLKALAKVPADRYPTPEDLANDLGRYLDGEPVAARSGRPRQRVPSTLRRRLLPGLTLGLAAVLFLLLGDTLRRSAPTQTGAQAPPYLDAVASFFDRDYAAAIAHATAAARETPTASEPPSLIGNAHLELALQLDRQGEEARADEHLGLAVDSFREAESLARTPRQRAAASTGVCRVWAQRWECRRGPAAPGHGFDPETARADARAACRRALDAVPDDAGAQALMQRLGPGPAAAPGT